MSFYKTIFLIFKIIIHDIRYHYTVFLDFPIQRSFTGASKRDYAEKLTGLCSPPLLSEKHGVCAYTSRQGKKAYALDDSLTKLHSKEKRNKKLCLHNFNQ